MVTSILILFIKCAIPVILFMITQTFQNYSTARRLSHGHPHHDKRTSMHVHNLIIETYKIMCDDNIITKILMHTCMYPNPSPKLHVPDSP